MGCGCQKENLPIEEQTRPGIIQKSVSSPDIQRKLSNVNVNGNGININIDMNHPEYADITNVSITAQYTTKGNLKSMKTTNVNSAKIKDPRRQSLTLKENYQLNFNDGNENFDSKNIQHRTLIRSALTMNSNSQHAEINYSALQIEKYFKDQVPPTDKKTPFVDPLFPPNIDSLVTRIYRLKAIMEPLIRRSFQGEEQGEHDLVKKRTMKSFNYDTKEIEWYRPKDMFPDGKFTIFENKIEIDDIIQGNVGDCYFMASLAAMCKTPQLIMELFRQLTITENGCYEVVMRIEGVWQVVIIDDYFPCHKGTKKPLFAQSNGGELWVMILEKAWAKVNDSYSNFIGGWSNDVLFSITNFPVNHIIHKNYSREDCWDKINDLKRKNYILTCASKDDPAIEKFGLIRGHSFTIMDIKQGVIKGRNICLLRLRNPWGYREWNGRFSDKSKEWDDQTRSIFNFFPNPNKSDDDGEFYMEFYDYLRFFIITEVCQLSNKVCLKEYEINDVDVGNIFEVKFKFTSDLKVQGIKQCHRFHREIPKEAELNMNIILIEKLVDEETGKIHLKYIDSITDGIFNPLLDRNLKAGNYLIYIHCDYNYSNFDKRRLFRINISSNKEFKSKKYNLDDENFSFLEGIIKSSIFQVPSLLQQVTEDKVLSSLTLNRFENTSYGFFYLKNNLDSKSIVVNVAFHLLNMYVINTNDKILSNKLNEKENVPEKSFEIELKPNEEFLILGIRKLYYEPFCFGITCKYIVSPLVKLRLSLDDPYKNFTKLLSLSPPSTHPKTGKYYDFIHSKFPIDIKKLCEIVNTKNNAVEMYTQKFPEEMKEILKIPKIGDMVDVTFYDKTRCDDKQGTYLGEWKSKNPFVKHGRGMFIFDDGSKYVGQIKEDFLEGFGKLYQITGEIIEIQFQEDEMHGIGYLTNKKGQKIKVEYDYGALIKTYD